MVPEKFYSLLILFLSLEMVSDINELFEPFTAEINIEKIIVGNSEELKANNRETPVIIILSPIKKGILLNVVTK